MIERMCVNVSDTNCISVEFNDQIFNLEFAGDYNEFVNNFIPMFKDFANGVIEEYLSRVQHKPNYEECFDSMIADFETVNCPYWKHIVGPFNILFDTSAFEEDKDV